MELNESDDESQLEDALLAHGESRTPTSAEQRRGAASAMQPVDESIGGIFEWVVDVISFTPLMRDAPSWAEELKELKLPTSG